MEINIRITSGHYDLCRPNESQDNVRICLPQLDKPLNCLLKKSEAEDLIGEDWSIIVPEVLRRYIKGTLWSSNLDKAKEILQWAESDEGQEQLQKAWAKTELPYLVEKIEKLEKRKSYLINILK